MLVLEIANSLRTLAATETIIISKRMWPAKISAGTQNVSLINRNGELGDLKFGSI